ncbi:DUF6894 family protein [Microvirga roseola]|uniref:DUF6894 family protein n=1 Tax=Microvirga roseola TaxID=2883126 RepID=UPI001E5DA6B5|nr:hypothetical protein [Microvirga roseola]
MRHHFHCTDGRELILDLRGRPLRADGDALKQAEAVARRLMAEVLISADWSRWLVCVHNELGEQIAVVPFPHARRVATPIIPLREWTPTLNRLYC